jgi:hypothetical protein
LVVVGDHRSFFRIHVNFKLMVLQLHWPWCWAELLLSPVRCCSCFLSVSFLVFISSSTLKSPITRFFLLLCETSHCDDIRPHWRQA